jgi:glycosyltransferase involved in cell wall biosynthesis
MKILQIHPVMKSTALSPAGGGMAGAALNLTRLLAERGHEVQILPIPEGVGSRELWEVAPGRAVEVAAAMHIPGWREAAWLPGALLRLRPRSKGVKNVLYDSFALTALRRELQLFRPDVVHNHLARMPFPRLARALSLGGNLLLTHHHGEPGEGLEAYDRIVFPSRSARDAVAPRAEVAAERTRCIYSPVASAFRRAAVVPDRPGAGVVFVGAVRRRKGIDLLLDAYRSERSLWTEPLWVCGRGEDEELVRRAEQDGLPVRWRGQLAPGELAQTVAAARLAVIPSRLEGFSIAILEALCCGTPVIGWAPQIRELGEFLGTEVGWPFDGRTQGASELAGLLRAALGADGDSFERRSRLAEAAREAFSEERYIEAYLELYREMIAAAGSATP